MGCTGDGKTSCGNKNTTPLKSCFMIKDTDQAARCLPTALLPNLNRNIFVKKIIENHIWEEFPLITEALSQNFNHRGINTKSVRFFSISVNTHLFFMKFSKNANFYVANFLIRKKIITKTNFKALLFF